MEQGFGDSECGGEVLHRAGGGEPCRAPSGAGADKVGDGLGLGEVEFPGEEGSAGKFAGPGGAAAAGEEVVEDVADDERVAVAGDFEEVFAGGGGGRGVIGENDLVEGLAGKGVIVAESGVARGGKGSFEFRVFGFEFEGRSRSGGRGRAQDRGGERGDERAAGAHDGERGFARGRRGGGGDGFGEGHEG